MDVLRRVAQNLGLAYRALEQPEQAADAFRRATRVRRDYAPGWFNLATTLNDISSISAFVLGGSTLIFLYNIYWTHKNAPNVTADHSGPGAT